MNFPLFRRALKEELSYGALVTAFIVVIVLGLWIAWFFLADITIYKISKDTRVEVLNATYPILPETDGMVIRSEIRTGEAVNAGDVLIELNHDQEDSQIGEAESEVATLREKKEARRRERAAEERTLEQLSRTAELKKREASSRVEKARTEAAFADEKLERNRRLRDAGHIAELDFLTVKDETQQKKKLLEIEELSQAAVDREWQSTIGDQTVKITRLVSEISGLEGEIAQREMSLDRLRNDRNKRLIKASVAGVIGEAADIRPGSRLEAGESIGVIFVSGNLHVVSHFTPDDAFGLIRPGQIGRVRLNGFPWTRYGTLGVVVERVAGEVRDETVRVDLTIPNPERYPIELQHGLRGSCEIAVQRLSPSEIVLQEMGKMLTSVDN